MVDINFTKIGSNLTLKPSFTLKSYNSNEPNYTFESINTNKDNTIVESILKSIKTDQIILFADLNKNPTTLFTMTTLRKKIELVNDFWNLISFKNKNSFITIFNTEEFFIFMCGIFVFTFLFFFSFYLDLSLRNQIFYIFDNCTKNDYMNQYIIKIRFGINRKIKKIADIVIEFYDEESKSLSKFIVNGNYLENGLSIGTNITPDMKITNLYLFRSNSLSNLEYCRAYLILDETKDSLSLYSIEVGSSKNIKLFYFDQELNREGTKKTKYSLIIEEKMSIKYSGPTLDTSYTETLIFIFFYFCFSFFVSRLFQSQKMVQFFFIINTKLDYLTSNVFCSLTCGLLYLIFRELIHIQYAMNYDKLKWTVIHFSYIFLIIFSSFYFVATSILTKLSDSKRSYCKKTFFFINFSLIFWMPLAFLYFYSIIPQNYYLNKIILKNFKSLKSTKKNESNEKSDSKRKNKLSYKMNKKIFSKKIDNDLERVSYTNTQNDRKDIKNSSFNSYGNILSFNKPKAIYKTVSNKTLKKSSINKSKSLKSIIPSNKSIKPTVKTTFKLINKEGDSKKSEKTASKTSIGSTGSDYYAAMFKDGTIPKVGSISQYGALLKKG